MIGVDDRAEEGDAVFYGLAIGFFVIEAEILFEEEILEIFFGLEHFLFVWGDDIEIVDIATVIFAATPFFNIVIEIIEIDVA